MAARCNCLLVDCRFWNGSLERVFDRSTISELSPGAHQTCAHGGFRLLYCALVVGSGTYFNGQVRLSSVEPAAVLDIAGQEPQAATGLLFVRLGNFGNVDFSELRWIQRGRVRRWRFDQWPNRGSFDVDRHRSGHRTLFVIELRRPLRCADQ